MEPVESTSYSYAYLDPKWGWVSGGQGFTDRGQCVARALNLAQTSGVKVRLTTMTTVSVIEDLPLPGQP